LNTLSLLVAPVVALMAAVAALVGLEQAPGFL
jgi:hypothetical protein